MEPTVSFSAVAPASEIDGLPETTAIAIGASIGGAVCLILSLIGVALCVARKRRNSASRSGEDADVNLKARGESSRSAHSTLETADDLPTVIAGTGDLPIAVLGSEYGHVPEALHRGYERVSPGTEDMARLGT